MDHFQFVRVLSRIFFGNVLSSCQFHNLTFFFKYYGNTPSILSVYEYTVFVNNYNFFYEDILF